jgi:hypothetical protein
MSEFKFNKAIQFIIERQKDTDKGARYLVSSTGEEEQLKRCLKQVFETNYEAYLSRIEVVQGGTV